MKKLIFAVSSFALLMSCEKEIEKNNNNSERVTVTENTLKASNLRLWYDNGGDNYVCAGSGGNCFPDIIVTPHLAVPIENFSTNGSLGNYTSLHDLISSNMAVYEQIFDRSDLDAVLSGVLKIKTRGNTGDAKKYILFYSDNTIKAVYPLIK